MKAILLLVACFLLLSFALVNAEWNDWVFHGEGGNYSFFYNKTSIKTQPSKHIRVWQKSVAKDVTTFIEERRGRGLTVKGYENYARSLTLWEIDCNKKQVGMVSTVDYDKDGNVLDMSDFEHIKMVHVAPDSIGESLCDAVCKGRKHNHKRE